MWHPQLDGSVLFFIHHASRRVLIAGITTNPDGAWMMQVARNLTMEGVAVAAAIKKLSVLASALDNARDFAAKARAEGGGERA